MLLYVGCNIRIHIIRINYVLLTVVANGFVYIPVISPTLRIATSLRVMYYMITNIFFIILH